MKCFLKIWSERQKRLFSRQLFFSMFSASFLLLVLGLFVLYQISVDAATDINNEMTQATLQVAGENLDHALSRVDDVVRSAFFHQNMLSSMSQDFSKNPAASNAVRNGIVTAVASYDLVSAMELHDSLGNTAKTEALLNTPYTDYAQCVAYFENVEKKIAWGKGHWYFLQKDPWNAKDYCIKNIRQITPTSVVHQKEVLLVTSISETKLAALYGFLGADSYIMLEDGTVVSAVDKSKIGNLAPAHIVQRVAEVGRSSAILLKEDGIFFYSIYLPTISSHLIVSSGDDILRITNRTIGIVAATLLILGLIVSACWANYISEAMTRPITALKGTMEQARAGDFSVRSELYRLDELGYLSESFNHMMASLEQRIEERDQQQLLAKESELRLLQTQINPHLLYNTLDSALYLIVERNAERAAWILEEMSRFFKLSLQSGNKVVTLEDELQHVSAYLNLQNLGRMKDFTLQINGELALRQTPILHMLLQPIVENSVLHGFDGSLDDGLITIDLVDKDGALRIHIMDNGVGMSEDELQVLRTRLEAKQPPGGSFALWNIAQRMKMFYGPTAAIAIESEFGEYTAVTLQIPQTGEQEGGFAHV